ncbi:S-adenosyl-L-methionine-dependent methyltransferase [Cladochytrium replicatum]|nr:S-adenosyl-L-methionine-dependent methyltransferase [Cladochytrium replicatum]
MASGVSDGDASVNALDEIKHVTVDFHAVADWSTELSSKASKETYMLPNDDTQFARMNLLHHLIRHTFGGVNYKGIDEDMLQLGATVLDIGCGTGIWLAEMQRDFAEGDYVGIDIELTEWAKAFQKLSKDSIRLVEGDVLRPLPFDDETFDYVHQQDMSFAIPTASWSDMMFEFFRVTKPGGIIDLVELQFPEFPNGNRTEAIGVYLDLATSIFNARGANPYIARELHELVDSSKLFEEVECIEDFMPLGWSKDGESSEVGRLWALSYQQLLLGSESIVTAALSSSPPDWKAFVAKLMVDLAEVKAVIPITPNPFSGE